LASIVVGLDFSECSRVALGHAQRLASWSGAQVHPVHVVAAPVDEVREDATLTVMQRGIREGLVADALERWQTFMAGSHGAPDLRLDVHVAHRLVGIRRQLDQHHADLLVLGAFGEEKPRVGMGTLASGCVRSVPADVLIVRDDHPGPFRTVVVGIDFSPTSRRALHAAALIAHGEGARLYAAHVVPDRVQTIAGLRSELGPTLDAFVNETTCRFPGLRAQAEVFPYAGHRSGVLEFAALVNADLVALGTRGRSNLRDVVLGSTAEKVLRDSVCAVLAAKPRS
jgi:nucleotide-binding universal stress UspA family protein